MIVEEISLGLIPQFFEWLSYIHLYPDYEAWNIVSVIGFMIWISVGFIHLRPKLGILKGALFSLFFAFTIISLMDIVSVILNIRGLLYLGWKPINFISRWAWKFFLTYWLLRLIKKYDLVGKTIVIDVSTIVLTGLYWFSYFAFDYMLFFPYTFRESFMTPYPRWFVFMTGHLFGYIFCTLIYISIWRFDMPDEPFLREKGMGEVYMLYALQRVFHKIQMKYPVHSICELKSVVSVDEFPDRDWNWVQNVNALGGFDLIYTYNGFPDRVNKMKEFMDNGAMIMWSATIPKSIGYYLQHIIGDLEDKYYASRKDLIKQAENAGITVLESGYFDAPFWPDHSKNVIAPTRQLGIDMKLIKQMTILESIKTRFTSHHAYVLGVYER